jgi:chorismate mutase-like protein
VVTGIEAAPLDLDQLRTELDETDRELTRLVAKRLGLCNEIGHLKRERGMPMMQPHRIAHVKQRSAELGATLGLSRDFVETLFGVIIDEACRREDEVIGEHAAAGAAPVRFAALGPAGTSAQYATRRYIEFHELRSAEIVPFTQFAEAIELVRAGKADYIVQNSAHPEVFWLTEAFKDELFVVDCFVCQTKPMGLLRQRAVAEPRSVGLIPATRGYFDVSVFPEVAYETANPIVGDNLLLGKYDAGFTFLEYAERHPDKLEVVKAVGAVDSAWLVYGAKRRANGSVLTARDSTWLRR